MDKKLGSPPLQMRGGVLKSHLHSRVESQSRSSPYPRPSSTDPAYSSTKSILLSALHGQPVQHQHSQQLPLPGIVHHRSTDSQHHISPISVGYQQNPHVPILHGSGLVNILPPGQCTASSLSTDLSGIPPHSQSSISSFSVLRPAIPDFNLLNSLRLPTSDSAVNFLSSQELSSAVKSDTVKFSARDQTPQKAKFKQDTVYEHLTNKNTVRDKGWNIDIGGSKSFDRNLGSPGSQALTKLLLMQQPPTQSKYRDDSSQLQVVYTTCGGTNELLRRAAEQNVETGPQLYRPVPSARTSTATGNVQTPNLGGGGLIQVKACEVSTCKQNDSQTYSNTALTSNYQNNDAMANVNNFYDINKDRRSSSFHQQICKNVSHETAKMHKLLVESQQSDVIFPSAPRTFEDSLTKIHDTSSKYDEKSLASLVETTHNQSNSNYGVTFEEIVATENSHVDKMSTQGSLWGHHLHRTNTCSSSREQSTKVTVCMANIATSTTSVHIGPIQSLSTSGSKSQNSMKITGSQKLFQVQSKIDPEKTDITSKSENLHKLLEEVTNPNLIKTESTTQDLLDIAKKARDSQKAHLDVIKMTLESDLGLIHGNEVKQNKLKNAENVKQQTEKSSHKCLIEKVENQPENSTGTHDEPGSGRTEESELKLLEQHGSAFNRRPCTLNNFPFSQTSFRATHRSHSMAVHRAKLGSISTPVKSLDLLRQNLQKFINSELDSVVQKYINMFFKPAVDNIRENSGSDAVSDDAIIMLSAQMLEEAKKLYVVDQHNTTPEGTVFDPGSKTLLQENTEIRASKHSLFHIKRRGSSDSDRSFSRKRVKKSKGWAGISGRSTPSKKNAIESVKKEGPKWDPERLTVETEFVMGSRANKALGLGNMRGRLYVKHPDLFKYIGDQDDKQWLNENRYMPSTGGKAYLLVVSDICDIADTEEYRNGSSLQMDEIISFTVPEWMIEKMKLQMKSQVTARGSKAKLKQPVNQDAERLPFSSMYSSEDLLLDSKSEFQGSPATTDQMDLLSVDQDDLDTPTVSPFNMTGGFKESSPLASPLVKMQEDECLMATFDFH